MEDNLFPAGSFKDTDMKNKTFKEMVEPWEPSPKNDGVVKQIQDRIKNAPLYDEPISLKMIEDLMSVLMEKRKRTPSERGFMATGYCESRGLISFNFMNDWCCSSETCGLCAPFVKALTEIVYKDSIKIGKEHAERFPEDIKKIEPKGSKYHK
jgi:hypothetical protein